MSLWYGRICGRCNRSGPEALRLKVGNWNGYPTERALQNLVCGMEAPGLVFDFFFLSSRDLKPGLCSTTNVQEELFTTLHSQTVPLPGTGFAFGFVRSFHLLGVEDL